MENKNSQNLIDKKYILENEYVQLRPLAMEDIKYIRPFVKNEPELWKYSLASMRSEMDAVAYIQSAINLRTKGSSYPFMVYDKLKHEYAGMTRFYEINHIHKSCAIGYTWYGKNFQGTGVNKSCKFLMLSHAFDQMNMERVEFTADVNNVHSIAAMKSNGCVEEGILRNHFTTPTGRRDTIILSILQSEWTSVSTYLQKRIGK
ncbi:GNAT family N-acetyltransferase [Aquimarina intermedia]|uniref:RimJ/RimL family protein N-acetyltransferase n=1 Tax=Aquimarina intermedia TaxID=350814 RepID=A0A5S5C359_9FLAO|nr:GNAT family protein [Aquimarina intermedia]TYP72912.1 RimJ/RimL family protein N-acetyltransferase [Aquimarina intermedia]